MAARSCHSIHSPSRHAIRATSATCAQTYITKLLIPKARDRVRSLSVVSYPTVPYSISKVTGLCACRRQSHDSFVSSSGILHTDKTRFSTFQPPFSLFQEIDHIHSHKKSRAVCSLPLKEFGLPSICQASPLDVTSRGTFLILQNLLHFGADLGARNDTSFLNLPQRLGQQHEMRDKLRMIQQTRPLPSSDFELHLYDHFHERRKVTPTPLVHLDGNSNGRIRESVPFVARGF
jgi:hypothetical protein